MANQIKGFLRNQILKQRKELSEAEAASKSREIALALKKIPEYKLARTISVYVSSKDREVGTREMIANALEERKRVAVPVTRPKEKRLDFSLIDSVDDLVPGTFGILEPKEEDLRLVPLSEIELFVVPGIIFDRAGFRIGFGGGYYDRVIPLVRVPVIGLAYEFQIVRSLPPTALESHDQPVTATISEYGIIRPVKN